MSDIELHATGVATIEIGHVVGDDELEQWPSICSNLKITLHDSERNQILVIRANTHHAKLLQRDAIKLVDKRQKTENPAENPAEHTNAK